MDPGPILEEAAAAAARATDPEERGRLEVLVHAARLRLGLSEDVAPLAGAPLSARFDALLHVAMGGGTPRSLVVETARAAAEALAGRGHDKVVGLALWAGVDPKAAGFAKLSETGQRLAVERALRGGYPAALEEAAGWLAKLLGRGETRDAAVGALMTARMAESADAARWVEILKMIDDPAARLRALHELALRTAEAAPGAMGIVDAALEVYDDVQGAWRGEAAALLGGVAVLGQLAGATTWIGEAWAALDGIIEPAQRAAACATLLRAESQHGLTPWQQAFATISRDGLLRARSKRWAESMVQAADAARFTRGPEAERRAAVKQVQAQLERVQVPELQAEAFATVAAALGPRANIYGDAEALDDALHGVRTALQQTQDPRVRLGLIPQVARQCAHANPEVAVTMVRLARGEREAVTWLLAVAESAG